MKVINANNIEKWMFDYFEGNLSLHEKIELEGFVKENPVYQADFDAWSKAYVTEEPFVYANADTLIKKGFFEDKKLLILFIALIGTGILMQNLTGDETQETLLANNNQKLIKEEVSVTKKGSKANSKYTSTAKQNTLVEEEVYFSIKNDTEKQLEKVEVFNDYETQNNSSAIVIKQNLNSTTISINDNTNKDVINTPNVVTNISTPSNTAKKVRELAKMYSYSENNISSVTEQETVKNNTQKTEKPEIDVIEVKDYKGGIVDYKKKNKRSFNHYKTKTLSKSLSRMLNKDLLLTVYNNRLTLKGNQLILAANSAFAGNVSSPRLQLNYERLSFAEMNDFKLSFDSKVKNLNAGIGVMLSNSGDYVFNKKEAEFVYAHWFDIGGVQLTGAIKAGVNQTGINWNRIGVSGLTVSANDSVNNSKDIGFNVAPSLMVKLPFAYAGIQINDAYSSTNKFVNNYKTLELENKASYSIIMGTDYRKNFGNRFVISPQMYIDIFNDSRKTKYTFATTMQYNNFLVGAGYTNDKTFRGILGFDVKGFRMAYNAQFDLDLYSIEGADGIKHEIAIQYIITKKKTGILLYD